MNRDKLIEKCAIALHREVQQAVPQSWDDLSERSRGYYRREALAVIPLIEADIREQVAQEIEALDGFDLSNGGLVQKHAARIARGATQNGDSE